MKILGTETDVFLRSYLMFFSLFPFTREQTSCALQKQTLLSEIYAERSDTDQLWRPYLRRVLSDFPVPYNITLTSGLINQQILHHAKLKVYKPSNCKIKLIDLLDQLHWQIRQNWKKSTVHFGWNADRKFSCY